MVRIEILSEKEIYYDFGFYFCFLYRVYLSESARGRAGKASDAFVRYDGSSGRLLSR